MTVLPLQRIQCDRCRTVIVLVATCSDHWGAELRGAGWRPADPRQPCPNQQHDVQQFTDEAHAWAEHLLGQGACR